MSEVFARPAWVWRDRGDRAQARLARFRRTVLHPVPRPPGGDPRPRHPREVADRLGQDARVRGSDRRTPLGGRECPEALVLVPTRELALQVAEEIGSFASGKNLKVASPTAAPRCTPRQSGSRARTSSSRRRADSRICSSAGSSRSTASGSSSSTRPTACSTWASARRSTGSCAACRTSARRCSSRRRSTARSASSPGRTRTIRLDLRPAVR